VSQTRCIHNSMRPEPETFRQRIASRQWDIEIAIQAQYEHDTVDRSHAIRVRVKAAGTYAISA